MWKWLSENISTVIIAAILLVALTAIAVKLIKNKKQGKSSCGCGCKGCALCEKCCGARPATPPRETDSFTKNRNETKNSFS